jgi:hypothetical protein
MAVTGHQINFNDFTALAGMTDYKDRLVEEATNI